MPGTTPVMMLRNSERSTFKTCRHRWQWTYFEGRQAAMAPYALRFGDLVHQALALYYKKGTKRGPHPAKSYERLYEEQARELGDRGFDIYSDEKWVDALPLGIGMLEGYVERFAGPDQEWEVIESEQTFQLLIKIPPHLIRHQEAAGGPVLRRFKVVGTFDGVWRHRANRRVIFREFKTAASIKEDGLAMDDQASLYWTYGPRKLVKDEVLKKDQLISSIGYRFLRKAVPPTDRPRNAEGHYLNKDGSVSKNQPAKFFHEVPVYRDLANRALTHERVCAEAVMIWRARHGLEPLIKNPGPLHMPNCVGCAVREACEVHEAGGDFAPVLAQTTVAWNPYAAHELPERS